MTFNATFGATSSGQWIVATATDPTGDTSSDSFYNPNIAKAASNQDSGGAANQFNPAASDVRWLGGPVIPNAALEPIFITDPTNGTSIPSSITTSLLSFISAMATSSFLPDQLAQYSIPGYTIGSGSGAADTVALAPDTTTPGPSSGNVPAYSDSSTDRQLQNLIAAEIALGRTAPPTANTFYIVYTPPGDAVNGGPGFTSVFDFGGYHSSFYDSAAGAEIYYQIIPDPEAPGPNNTEPTALAALESDEGVTTHETLEGIVDPYPSTGWTNVNYSNNNLYEIGDQAVPDSYNWNGNQVQYIWSNQLTGPGNAPGSSGNLNQMFINQLSPPAVYTASEGMVPVATFTDTNLVNLPADFVASVSVNGTAWTPSITGGANGVYVLNAKPPGGTLANGQYGVFNAGELGANLGFEVYVADNLNGGPNNGDPYSVMDIPFQVSSSAVPMIYNADSNGTAHNFSLDENTGTGNYELWDNNQLVFVQPIALTTAIDITAGPGASSSLTINYSGGTFSTPVTFDGGTGSGTHSLSFAGNSSLSETETQTSSTAGSVAVSNGQTVSYTDVNAVEVAPTVSAVSPNSGASGTSVTITGTNFYNVTSISFGSNSVTSGYSVNAAGTQITLSAPSGSGLVNVTITTTYGGQSAQSSNDHFTYVAATPVVTSSTASLAANATSITISGTGFDTTAAHDSVSFSNGVTGTVSSATSTSLTVTSLSGLSSLTGGAALNASVTVDGVSSGSMVQVATVAPVVTSSTAGLAANATSITLSGLGFDATAANDSVTFSNGVTGTVSSATSTSLTVTSLSGLSSLTAGTALNASVTVDGTSSGSPVQVATVAPVVTSSTASLAANATSITISGLGFDATAAHDSVTFSNGVTGTVSSATSTSLTVTSLSGLSSLTGGAALNASVTVDGVSSGSMVQVATVAPVVTSSTASLAANATSITISGLGFDATAAHDSVTFSNGVTGTVSSATVTSLTVTSLSGLSSLTGGAALNASVTVDGVSSGSMVQVATVAPVVTSSTAGLAANATSITISGLGFDATAANDSVSFSNGVTGTVSSATSTSLTVTSLSGLSSLTAGTALNASVTVDGTSSGSPVQVATVAPVVTSSTASLAANATSITISGLGFDATAAHDSVTFSNGVTGTVSSATVTSLTVTSLSGLSSLTAGTALNASVAVDGVSSGSPVQVATVAPVVSSSTASLAANATSITISGLGFDATAANDSVTFSNGVTGTVSSATSTSLTVTSLSGLSSLTPGTALNASVAVDGTSSGSPVQVATVSAAVTAPTVTSSTANLSVNATSITISGTGFDATSANDSVSFGNGVTGTVSSATSTSLTVTSLSGLSSLTPGTALNASVTVDGTSSGSAVQVATVAPVISASTASLPANAASITISGLGFDATAANDSVTFSNGVTGTVSSATSTSLTVTSLSGLSSLTAGTALNASVTVDGVSSGSAVQVATVAPVVTSSTASLAANATSITLSGLGFDATAANDSVTFSNSVTGTVSSATSTSLTVTSLSGLSSLTAGTALNASVAVDGVSSGSAVQVATVAPVVTSSTASLAANATSITLSGLGFDATAAHDSVTFSNGVTGTVSSATSTSLTVTSLSGLSSLTAGTALDASVTVDGVSSGSPVQVATVAPVVSSSTASLAANATSITISGTDFDATAAHDSVTFSNGVTGTVSSATSTSLTVTSLSGLSSLTAGTALNASVTVDGTSSGSAVQVAMVAPVVTSGTASLAANATSITISGLGFDATAANDSVTFGNGVTGTVSSATSTSLTVTSLSGLSSLTAGTALDASVTVDGVSSGSPVQVATVAPVVTSSTASLPANAASITISGIGFDATAAHDSVSFSNGVTGTVSSATSTSLTVTSLSGLSSLTAGTTLNASVTVDGVSSGSPVQVATVQPASTVVLRVSPPAFETAGTAFSVTVSARDAFGNTANFNGAVTLSSSDGQTVYGATVSLVNGVGTAQVTLDVADRLELVAVGGGLYGISGVTTVQAATPSTVQVYAPTVVEAGVAFAVTVAARDAFGNGYTGLASLTPSDGQSGAPTSVSLVNGVGVAVVTLDQADTLTLQASVNGTVGASNSFTVYPAGLVSLAVSAPGTATTKTAFGVTVTALDAFGNTITGFTGGVVLLSSDGQPVSPYVVMLSNGVGTAQVTLNRADPTELIADYYNILGYSNTITVSGPSTGAPVTFQVSPPASVTAGSAFTITVTAKDAYGNTTGYNGTVTLYSTDGQQVYGSTVALTQGVGTAEVTLDVADRIELVAVGGGIYGVSGLTTVQAATPSTVQVYAPTVVEAGSAFAVYVEARDQFGNAYTGLASLTPSDGQGGAPTWVSLVNGVGVAAVTFDEADTLTLNATVNGTTGTSNSVTVYPAGLASFAVSAPSTATAGTAFSVQVKAQDAFGNTLTGFTGAVALLSSDGQTASPNAVLLTNGIGTAQVTLNQADATGLIADYYNILGSSGTIQVSAASTPSPAGPAVTFQVSSSGQRDRRFQLQRHGHRPECLRQHCRRQRHGDPLQHGWPAGVRLLGDPGQWRGHGPGHPGRGRSDRAGGGGRRHLRSERTDHGPGGDPQHGPGLRSGRSPGRGCLCGLRGGQGPVRQRLHGAGLPDPQRWPGRGAHLGQPGQRRWGRRGHVRQGRHPDPPGQRQQHHRHKQQLHRLPGRTGLLCGQRSQHGDGRHRLRHHGDRPGCVWQHPHRLHRRGGLAQQRRPDRQPQCGPAY